MKSNEYALALLNAIFVLAIFTIYMVNSSSKLVELKKQYDFTIFALYLTIPIGTALIMLALVTTTPYIGSTLLFTILLLECLSSTIK